MHALRDTLCVRCCPQHLVSQACPVLNHNGTMVAQGPDLDQWFAQQCMTYAILKSNLRHDRPKVAPAKARPGAKSSMLGRSHARAATNFALMKSEPKTREYDAPADTGETGFIVEMHQPASWQSCAQRCSCIQVRCTISPCTLAAECPVGDQVTCMAIYSQENLNSMLNNCVLLLVNSPWDASCVPTFNLLDAEHRSAQTQI